MNRWTTIGLGFLAMGIASCDQDEPQLGSDLFLFDVSKSYIYNSPSLLIFSDYSGNVLAIESLLREGQRSFEVPKTPDGIYHVTLLKVPQNEFDHTGLFTYAFIPPGQYSLSDFSDNSPYETIGKHVINFSVTPLPTTIITTGSHINSTYFISPSWRQFDLADTSDLYFYFRNNQSQLTYVYLPQIVASDTTVFDQAMYNAGVPLDRIAITSIDSQNEIFTSLSASRKDQISEMSAINGSGFEFELSNASVSLNGAAGVFVPTAILSTFRFFKTRIHGPDGSEFVSYGPSIATAQKKIQFQQITIEESDKFLRYSITGDMNQISWMGSFDNVFWDVVSKPGTDLTINLPKFSSQFKAKYNLTSAGLLDFYTVSFYKDSRYSGYLDYTFRPFAQNIGAFENYRVGFSLD